MTAPRPTGIGEGRGARQQQRKRNCSPEAQITSLVGAVWLLDDWIAAYEELRCDYLRLQRRCEHFEFLAEHRGTLLRHLEAFLPVQLREDAEQAKQRMKEGGKRGGESKGVEHVPHPLPDTGKARDQAAKQFGEEPAYG